MYSYRQVGLAALFWIREGVRRAFTLSAIWGVLSIFCLMNCHTGSKLILVNTGRGVLECSVQSPISDSLPHNAPDRFRMRARESLLYSRWQHNCPTGYNNGQSSFIHRRLWVVLWQASNRTAKYLSGILNCNNALVLFSDCSRFQSWSYCWKVT